MDIKISFPEIGNRIHISAIDSASDSPGCIEYKKQISSRITVSKLEGVHPSVELTTHYTEDFDPSVSFAEFELRASMHIKNILSDMKIHA